MARKTEGIPSTWKDEIMDLLQRSIEKAVDDKLAAIFGGVIGTEAPRREGKKPAKKFTISMPADVYQELKRLPGTPSSNITAAVRLLLNARRQAK